MELFWRYNQVSLLRFWKVVGILPEKLLEEISNAMSLGEIVEGIRPEKLFCCRFTYWSEGMERMSEGRFPLRPLEWRLRILRESSFPRLFSGIEPLNPAPGRWISMTLVPFWLQVTPAQDVQIGVDSLQFSLGACGTLEKNSRRACLSEFKSASIRPKRDTVKLSRTNGTAWNWNFIGACLVWTVKWRQVVVPSSDLSCSSFLLGSALEDNDKVLANHIAKNDKIVQTSKS